MLHRAGHGEDALLRRLQERQLHGGRVAHVDAEQRAQLLQRHHLLQRQLQLFAAVEHVEQQPQRFVLDARQVDDDGRVGIADQQLFQEVARRRQDDAVREDCAAVGDELHVRVAESALARLHRLHHRFRVQRIRQPQRLVVHGVHVIHVHVRRTLVWSGLRDGY